jgi:cyclase
VGLGVEKVAISSAVVDDPGLITRIAEEIGRQSVVVVFDVKKRGADYEVCTRNGQKSTGCALLAAVRAAEAAGAGEIVVNSIDNDGQMTGYDLTLAKLVRDAVRLPMTVLGGAGSLADIGKLLETCGVVGAAAGSFFVFKGTYRAVLISYPAQAQKEEIIRAAWSDPPRR